MFFIIPVYAGYRRISRKGVRHVHRFLRHTVDAIHVEAEHEGSSKAPAVRCRGSLERGI
jgi:hypothetical protein